MTPEGKVKDNIKKVLKAHGAYYAMPMGTGFGNAGVPDFLVCLNGEFLGIEAKAGKGTTTALQKKNIAEIEAAGGRTLVINEDNFELLEAVLENMT
tara:strand:+ start:1016 stop:1303 length:288 start_codon:yes stop_codon:yes gene_type:complete